MYVHKGGQGFPWCPGKATWDQNAVSVYNILKVCAESGNLWDSGGIADQPAWFIDLLAWFLPRYNDLKFDSKCKSVLGDPNTKSLLGQNKTTPGSKGLRG